MLTQKLSIQGFVMDRILAIGNMYDVILYSRLVAIRGRVPHFIGTAEL